MFGKRSTTGAPPQAAPQPAPRASADSPQVPVLPEADTAASRRDQRPIEIVPPTKTETRRSDDYYQTKSMIFGALIEAIDLAQLTRLDAAAAREEIRDIVNEIIALKNVVMSIAEQEDLLEDICNDVLGYGPLEPLLARDDIADIMVNGANKTYIEVGGRIQLTNVRFRDNQQLMNICQRIVSQVGRRVDESSPICDARLPDGSRVNVIAPPLAIDGPSLTIRKFKKDKLTLDQLVRFGAISPEGARVLEVIGRVRCNVVISGGTGSGKTTLLNCLTNYIENDERVITCEDAAELQLQQPHTVRLETRPPNLEGQGQVTMRDLVRNCLRMRPERIIVGEVRGPEAFDLLQAMNTGHDGSMGTIHSNSPRECLSRIESLITMGGFSLPSRTIKEMISSSIDVIIQATRLRDGSRRITHVTEVLGMEGDVITTQDIVVYDISGRGRVGPAQRAASLDRHRPAALLGAGALLQRGAEARRRARRDGDRGPGAGRVTARIRARPGWGGGVMNLTMLAAVILAAVAAGRRRLCLPVSQSCRAGRGPRSGSRPSCRRTLTVAASAWQPSTAATRSRRACATSSSARRPATR